MKAIRMAALALSVLTGCTLDSTQKTTITPEPAGENCAQGGVKIQLGTDAPSYVCSGADGAVGATGPAGALGATGLSAVVTAEPAGANCTYGGARVQVGGTGTPTYICNGAPGDDGASVSVSAEGAGANCSLGGVKVQVGTAAPSYVCNGATGDSASITAEAAGANCAAGGVKVQVGSGTPSYVCNGATGATGATGAAGAAGLSASITPEAAGSNCANGGVKVQVGTATPAYVCNGTNGTNGTNGADGLSASVTVEAAGSNCANGGLKVQVGTAAASYVCNGTNGTNGTDGVTPSVTALNVGNTNCPYGGVSIAVGTGTPSYACNGEPGADGANGTSVTVAAEAAGSNCQYGGVAITDGSSTRYACNGAPGATGATGATGDAGAPGSNGLNALVKETASFTPTGECPYGSKLIQVGTDDDADGTLEAGEVDSSFTVCLGSDGDGDGVAWASDNCRGVGNPSQADDDVDGVGDACDTTPCAGSKTYCTATCVDTQTDANNCGACGTVCTGGQVCRTGGCVTPVTIPTSPTWATTGISYQWATSLATGDWDGDGFLDVSQGSFTTAPKVYRRTGGTAKTGAYTQVASFTMSGDAYGATMADVNGDGRLDILTAGPNGSTASKNAVLLQSTDGSLGADRTMYQAHSSFFYGWGATVINPGTASQLAVWLTTEAIAVGRGLYSGAVDGTSGAFAGGFTRMTGFGSENAGIAQGDLDGDGDIDIIYGRNQGSGSSSGGLAIHLNDGAGNLPLLRKLTGQASSYADATVEKGPMDTVNVAGFAVGDLNGDGDLDLALVNVSPAEAAISGGHGVWIGLRTSADGAVPSYAWTRIASSSRSLYGAAIGDVTDDGKPDLVLDGRVYANLGAAPWFNTTDVNNRDLGGNSYPLLRDFNGDGLLDVGMQRSGSLQIIFR